jgi:hypothetical protein
VSADVRLHGKGVRTLWFLVLALLTAIFVAAIIAHTINYQSYIEETTKRWLDRGFDYEFIEGFIDFLPWHMYGMGPLIIPLGHVICLLWFLSLIAQAMTNCLNTLERGT